MPELLVGGRVVRGWQEAVEQETSATDLSPADLVNHPLHLPLTVPAHRAVEPVPGPGGIVGAVVRERRPLSGTVEVSARSVGDGGFVLRLRVENRTPLAGGPGASRDVALLQSLVSTHAILHARGGEFVSLLDPPAEWAAAVAGCRNAGAWPVLVGDEADRDAILASPIILYDHPQVAPESPGDLFDATEIDEILTLRILTLTDDEKREMIAADDRARDLLARTEALGAEDLMRLHGTVRGLRPRGEGGRG